MRVPYGAAVAAVVVCACAHDAIAQVLPSTVEAGRVERQLERPTEPVPPSSRPVAPRAVQAAPPNAADVRFTIRSFAVDGSTVYSHEQLTRRYALGAKVSLARIYEIAAELTARYRSDGYILSSVVVPAQKINDGMVRLRAVEGSLASVQYEGDLRFRDGLFEEAKQQLLQDKPLRAETLERFMLLFNDLPEVLAQAVLRPAPDTLGGTDLIVKLTQSRFSVDLGGNNRGSKLQGPLQYEAGVSFASLFGLYDQTSLHYVQSSEREELWLASLSHTERLTSSGLDVTVSGSVSRSSPELGPELQALNLETDTNQARVELTYPLTRSRAGNLRARAALSYHDGLTDTLAGPISEDKIAAVRLGMSFDNIDGWRGMNLIDVGVDQGVSLLGSSEKGDDLASRAGGDPQFTKVTLYLARLQSLGRGFSVLVAASGQYSFSNLLAPEEFAFGGEFYGRAYDPSEIVGDSGAAAKLEFRFTHGDSRRLEATWYAFYENGRVWRRLDATEVGAPDKDSAASAGGGVRFTFGPWLSGYIEGAVPLDHIIAAEGNDDARIFGGLKASFGR